MMKALLNPKQGTNMIWGQRERERERRGGGRRRRRRKRQGTYTTSPPLPSEVEHGRIAQGEMKG
jgi:hypothetical protein